MIGSIGYLLGILSIRNFCFAYFFCAPLFINQGMRLPVGAIFAAGYLFSAPIVLLEIARRLCSFQHKFRIGKLEALILSLAFISFLSVAVKTPDKLLSFDKHFIWYFKFLIPAFSFLIMVRMWKREDLSKLYTLLFVFVMISLGLTVTQIAVDIPPAVEPGRYSAFYRDSNHFAVLLNILYSFTLPMAISRMLEKKRGMGYPALNILLLIAIGLTGSRSGFLCTALLTGSSLIATRAWKTILPLGFLILPFLGFFVYIVKSRYTSGSGSAAMSDMGRIWTYLTAFNIIQANPLLGIGFGNVLDVFQEYGKIYAALIGRPIDIHNAFLEIFAETGILGFACYALLIGIPFTRLAKRVKADSHYFYPLVDLVGLNIVIVFLVHGMVYPEFLGHDDFWVYYSVVFLIMRSRIREPGFQFRLFPKRSETQLTEPFQSP